MYWLRHVCGSCSGQAIFLVDETYEPGFATVTIPYEFLPLPEKGDKGYGLGRDGSKVCEAEGCGGQNSKRLYHTNLLIHKVPADMAMKARFSETEIKVIKREDITMENIYDRIDALGEFTPQPDDDRIICRCEEVTKGEIRKAVHDGMYTITEIRRYCDAAWDFVRDRRVRNW